MFRILGLDYGAKYVGVAVSDPLGIIARPLEAIQRKEENKLRRTFVRIEELVKEYDIERIVVGLPKNMDDTEGESAAKCRDFAANVSRRTGIETVLWDERLSSVSANDILIESGVRREDKKKYIDKIAASIILRDYLNFLSEEKQGD